MIKMASFLHKRETLWMDSMATSCSTLQKALILLNAEVYPSYLEDIAYVCLGGVYVPMTIIVMWAQASRR
jgi:hypothetical protein